ncbi:MAG: arginyltransferase [Deltaproteobacteria bacterium]|nr:arginyltransferase [Deltaproteobacteria bacterium]
MEPRPRAPRRLAGEPGEWVIHDQPTPCVYLTGQTARLPLRLPLRRLGRAELGTRLEQGDRRQGVLLYRPSCPSCNACEPIRLDAETFRPTRTQKRIFRRGEEQIRTTVRTPRVTEEKVALYNRHKLERDLAIGDDLLDAESYREFLVDSCTETLEMEYRVGDELIAVALVDRAANGLSAVYCYFDPGFGHLSPGTYSILKQLELCRAARLQHLYLGLYVRGCATMEYKSRYLPHERLIDGRWQTFR